MRTRAMSAMVTVTAVPILGGCARASDPWDGCLKEKRARSEEQQAQLRMRVLHGWTDRQRAAHEIGVL